MDAGQEQADNMSMGIYNNVYWIIYPLKPYYRVTYLIDDCIAVESESYFQIFNAGFLKI